MTTRQTEHGTHDEAPPIRVAGVAPVIACISASEEIAAVLCEALSDAGCSTVPVVPDRWAREETLVADLMHLQPQACVVTVTPRSATSWHEVQGIRAGLPDCALVVITASPRAVEQLTGSMTAVAVLDLPFDLDELVAAVRRALGA